MNKKESSLLGGIVERLVNGLFKENPTFVLLLGMCPTLAVTTSAMNGLGMGLTTMVVLALSNLIISLLRKVIPNKVRIPAFIVIIASFVTMVELLLKAYIPSLYDALGIYIPLIVVNCIILGRAEAYAYSHNAILSLFDGIGMGLGFAMALTIIGGLREILGSGKIFGMGIMPESFVPVSIFVMAPGAFFVLALLTAIQNWIKDLGTKRGKDMSKIQSGCGGNCMECDKECKVSSTTLTETSSKSDEKENKAETNKESEESENLEKDTDSKKAETDPKPDTEEKQDDAENDEDKPEEPTEVKSENITEGTPEDKTEQPTEENPIEKSEETVNTEETAETESDKTEAVSNESAEDSGEEKTEFTENKAEVSVDDKDDDFEVLDFSRMTSNESAKKNKKKKRGNPDKARLLLSKAEETLKEDNDNA